MLQSDRDLGEAFVELEAGVVEPRSLERLVVGAEYRRVSPRRAGTEVGFGYRIVYVEPARIAAAVRTIKERPASLPFVREPVSNNPTLARAVTAAFQSAREPLALDALVLRLAEGLIEEDPNSHAVRPPRRLGEQRQPAFQILRQARRTVRPFRRVARGNRGGAARA